MRYCAPNTTRRRHAGLPHVVRRPARLGASRLQGNHPRRTALVPIMLPLSLALWVVCGSVAVRAGDPPVVVAAAFDAPAFVKVYCLECHQGEESEAGLDLEQLSAARNLVDDSKKWAKVLNHVRSGKMPPAEGMPLPASRRDAFVSWLEQSLRSAGRRNGLIPGPAVTRRMNRDEYSATISALLNIEINAGHTLPVDGAGGEGFDNAAETLFLSPIHAEKYLEAAQLALDYAVKDRRSRSRFLIAEPNAETTPEQAARKILGAFLPRAFRRPATARSWSDIWPCSPASKGAEDRSTESIQYAVHRRIDFAAVPVPAGAAKPRARSAPRGRL